MQTKAIKHHGLETSLCVDWVETLEKRECISFICIFFNADAHSIQNRNNTFNCCVSSLSSEHWYDLIAYKQWLFNVRDIYKRNDNTRFQHGNANSLLSWDEGHPFSRASNKSWMYRVGFRVRVEWMLLKQWKHVWWHRTCSFVSNDCVTIRFHFRYMTVSDAIKLIIEYIYRVVLPCANILSSQHDVNLHIAIKQNNACWVLSAYIRVWLVSHNIPKHHTSIQYSFQTELGYILIVRILKIQR